MSSKIFASVLEKIADLIYPPVCPLCGAFICMNHRPCESCEASLQRLSAPANFPHLRSVWFDDCRSCFAFDGALRDALHNFKYGARLELAKYLAGELSAIASEGADAVVPVPMHPRRLRERGFNQSALLASEVAGHLNLKLDMFALQRSRDVPPQVGLEKDMRLDNVKGVFKVEGKRAERIRGKKILLIDDVLTTGATANECARALKRAGADAVRILTVARTL